MAHVFPTPIPYLLDPGGFAPVRATEGAAGLDLRATEDGGCQPRSWAIIETGVRFAVPLGYCGLVRGRSGLAFNHRVTSFDGTIDSDYRGAVRLLLSNHTGEIFQWKRGDRLAQIVFVQALIPEPLSVPTLPPTARGEGGFGSTGRE